MSVSSNNIVSRPQGIGFPSHNVPIIDSDGLMTLEWYRFLMEMYQHSGLALTEFKMWGDLGNDGNSMTPDGTLTPTATDTVAPNELYAFSDAATEQAHGSVVLPGDYIDGSDLYAYVRWAPAGTNTGNVRWSIKYSVGEENAAFPAVTEAVMLDAGGGVALANQIVEAADDSDIIDGSSLRSGDALTFTVERAGGHGTDTLTGDALLIRAGFHYLRGVPGKNGRTQ